MVNELQILYGFSDVNGEEVTLTVWDRFTVCTYQWAQSGSSNYDTQIYELYVDEPAPDFGAKGETHCYAILEMDYKQIIDMVKRHQYTLEEGYGVVVYREREGSLEYTPYFTQVEFLDNGVADPYVPLVPPSPPIYEEQIKAVKSGIEFFDKANHFILNDEELKVKQKNDKSI